MIFDNIMSLTVGDMKDPAPWQQTIPWALALTRDLVGQIWIHHAGHDETRSYGDKTREWQMDTVVHLDAVKNDLTDVSFSMSFKKARERTPTTRFDFQNVKIALVNEVWEHELSNSRRPQKVSPQTGKALEALINVIAGEQAVPLSDGRRVAKRDDWQAECERLGLIDTKAKAHSARTLFSKIQTGTGRGNSHRVRGRFLMVDPVKVMVANTARNHAATICPATSATIAKHRCNNPQLSRNQRKNTTVTAQPPPKEWGNGCAPASRACAPMRRFGSKLA